MKKMFSILAVFLFALSMAGFSQSSRVGLTGGFTISDIMGNQNQMNHNVKTGYTVGLLVNTPLGGKFSFQPSLNYVQKGNLLKEDANVKVINALRYVEVPFNFLYSTNGKDGGFFVGLGPTLSFNVPSKRVTKNKKTEKKTSTDIIFGETAAADFRGIDYGANAVLGYRLPGGFFAQAYYNQGIRNLVTGEVIGDKKMRNACFGIQIGFLFNNK